MAGKKFSMFSNGIVVAHTNGKTIKASEEETIKYYAGLLPQTYKGASLDQVMYNEANGCIYGKYAGVTIKKKTQFAKVEEKKCKDCGNNEDDCSCGDDCCDEPKSKEVTAAQKDQTMPCDSVQDNKEIKVPRNESKSKPEKTDRTDVTSPKKLDENKIPRSKGNGGLEGGSKVSFDPEKAEKATSGNPDTYVQDFTKGEKPESAGSEKNRTAGTEISFRSESELYQNLKLAKEEKDDKNDLPDWLKGKKNDREEKTDTKKDDCNCNKKEDKKEAGKYLSLYTEAKTELQQKTAEINKMRLIESRNSAATKYALALLKVNPAKYADADTFVNTVKEASAKMSVEALNEAIEGLQTVQKEAEAVKKLKIEAAIKDETIDGGLTTAFVIQGENVIDSVASKEDELKAIFMSGSSFGRQLSAFEAENIK